MSGESDRFSDKPRVEQITETVLFTSRWLLVPMLIGLALVLLVLTVRFAVEFVRLLGAVFDSTKADVIIMTLSLVDLALIATLVVMVAISSYENFVSAIDVRSGQRKPTIFGRLDPGAIKIRLAIAIVAISSIHLLQIFLTIPETEVDWDYYTWKAIIHGAFVLTALGLAFVERMVAIGRLDRATTVGRITDFSYEPPDPVEPRK